MSPAIAAARNAGPPIAGGNPSIESSGAFIAAVFDGAGGADVEGVGRDGSEPVGSAVFGDSDGDGGCDAGAAGAGVTVGAALGATGGVALDGGAAMGCVAGTAVAAGSAGEFCDGFPPALPPVAAPGPTTGPTTGAAPGATFGVALGTGATSGIGPDVAAGDGSTLPTGCGDPLCGCAAFGFFCGGAVGSAGLCHGADVSPAGRLS
jgi:hypothetical protein